MIKEGPFLDALNKDIDGVILREIVTYRNVDGVIHKETTSRRYRTGGGDYHDTTNVTVLK